MAFVLITLLSKSPDPPSEGSISVIERFYKGSTRFLHLGL